MKTLRTDISNQDGFALAYLAVILTGLLLFTGLAVDSGRAYVVKAQLTKAVDGAALGAARNLNSGNPPKDEAKRIFLANFPPGYMGVTSVTDPDSAGFFTLTTNNATGVNVVTVSAQAVMPTTFMRLGNFQTVTVSSTGEATRRMVDLSLVVDVSGSIGTKWPAVRDAARNFVNGFDGAHDRFSLILYSYGASVRDQMPNSRGFNKVQVMADIPNSLPGGVTDMAEGVYRGWDELRTVPNGTQSSLRVMVLFTDGSGNTVPGKHDATGVSKGIFTSDFPKRTPDPDNITTNSPAIQGLYDTQSGTQNPSPSPVTVSPWTNMNTLASVPYMPVGTTSFHSYHRSAGIPNSFPLQTNTLTVNGASQMAVRGLANYNAGVMRYPATARNIRNSATNLTEILANEARKDVSGAYQIRIYTLGMGSLVQMLLGPANESSESVLMRIANDKLSPDFNNTQLEGKYYFAPTENEVADAFQNIQNQILRLTR